MTGRRLLESVGVALLVLFPYLSDFLLPSHLMLYHHRLTLKNLVGGLLVDIVVISLVCLGFIFVLSHMHGRLARVISAGAAGFVIWRAVWNLVFLLERWQKAANPQSTWIFALHLNQWAKPVGAVLVCVIAALALVRSTAAQRVTSAAGTVAAAFAFSAIWIVPQLAYTGVALRHQEATSFVHSISEAHNSHTRRIVWILFDELSQDLLFDHKLAGEEFPNFSRLRAASAAFTHVEPVGLLTDRIVLSLLSGESIQKLRSTPTGLPLYWNDAQSGWRLYDPGHSLFAVAKDKNWNPGVAGWYNPYCRVFSSILTTCSWEPGIQGMVQFEMIGASEDHSALENAEAFPKRILAKLHILPPNTDLIESNTRDYRSVVTEAHHLIENQQVRFAFIHLPVPHPPGIYDRKTHQFGKGGDYLDNLALADLTLGDLIKDIDKNSPPEGSIVIVSSDHSWRTPMWRKGDDWSDEEENIAGSGFDERPVLMIHFPGQVSATEFNVPMPELVEHAIISDMLKGELTTPQLLTELVARQSVAPNGSHQRDTGPQEPPEDAGR